MNTIRTVVKLNDAATHEKKWVVVVVQVSARIMGYVYQSPSVIPFKTKKEAEAFVKAEEGPQALCPAMTMCVGCCDPDCHKHTTTCHDPAYCPVHRKEG